MTDLPPGEWTPILIGDQWPGAQNLMVLEHSKAHRGNVKTSFTHFAGMLHNAQSGSLIVQRGDTIEDLRNAFYRGEEQARAISDNNAVKQNAYRTAQDSTLSLRHDLTGLAEEGNDRINEIRDSKEPAEIKVTQIVAVIHQYRALASLVAAKYCGNVLDATQHIFDRERAGQSARQFAQAHGLDLGEIFRRNIDDTTLKEQVRGFVDHAGSQPALTSGGRLPAGLQPADGTPQPPPEAAPPPAFGSGGRLGSAIQVAGGVPPTVRAATSPPALTSGGRIPKGIGFAGSGPAPTAPTASLPTAPSAPTPSPSGIPQGQLPAAPHVPAPFTPPAPAEPLTPAHLMQSFDNGMHAGAPFTAPAEAVPQAPMAPAPQAPPPTTPSTGPPAVAHAQAFDAPPVAHVPAPEAPTPIVAAPAAPAVGTPPAPAGSLPTYASDLRPTIQTAAPPSPPSPPPPSATPGSAAVHPSAGQSSTGQPTVVRQSTPPTPPHPPSNLPTQAAVATASGAVAGAASADAAARTRLQRLVNAVARQQPRLAWAAGDHADNTTVLATDLASGWIPPGIELPAVVTLLPPVRRRGDLETMLGEVSLTVAYTPIHHLPDVDEPIPTSPRPRRAPDVDELGPQLSQATQWRDGLPRLAHTLAKAASTGSGVLDSEVELLHQHLSATSARVLDSYPDHVDANDVGNWQLLAAIDALIVGDKTAANYHLAWFQALAVTTGPLG